MADADRVTIASPVLGEGTTLDFDPTTPLGQRLAKQLGHDMLHDTKQAAEAREIGQTDLEHDAVGVSDENAARVGGVAADRLRSIIERVERLEEERKALGNDIKDIFSEAKSAGFDVKVVRTIIKIRKQEPAEVEEQESLLDVYRRALGM